MKIAFITPGSRGRTMKSGKKAIAAFWFPSLWAPFLAGLTPNDIAIAIIDENITEINFNMQVDVVAISAMTFLSNRAYEIADKFRAKGVTVVIGGIHVSNCQNEAKAHADSIFIGEAEHTWPIFLKDLKSGTLKDFYEMKDFHNLIKLPHARLDLLQNKYMTRRCLQVTRGCPFKCEFCSVTRYCGPKYRKRPIDEVIEEIKMMSSKGLNNRLTTFVDDNIVGDKAYATEFFEKLIPLRIKWGSQGPINFADDLELLKLAVRSGMRSIFVGLETTDPLALANANKKFNDPTKYPEQIKTFHKLGIMVNAGMIFGFDNDDETVFERSVNFVKENKIQFVLFNILTPLPGTQLFQRLEKEKRIIHKNWSEYDGQHAVFKPSKMSPKVLEEGFRWANHAIYGSYFEIIKRLWGTQGFRSFVGRFIINREYGKLVRSIDRGNISPIAEIINNLRTQFPSRLRKYCDRDNHIEVDVINNAMISDANKIDQNKLIVRLKGAMDNHNIQKVLDILKNAKCNIVIDFEEIKYFAPQALNLIEEAKHNLKHIHFVNEI